MDCKIIQDLLPLYHDGVCSGASRAAVEGHLKTCGDCRTALAALDAPLPQAEKAAADDAAAVREISREWNRSKWKARMKGAVIAAAVCLLLAGIWLAATELYVFPVDTKKIQLTNLRQLSDGRILYHFYIDDDLNLRRTEFAYDEEGNMYCVPVRALITERRWEGASPANIDKELNLEFLDAAAEFHGMDEGVVRVWYGRGEDAILLWEENMELPAASEEDETAWGFDEEHAAYRTERSS